jgi:hypothetical protein
MSRFKIMVHLHAERLLHIFVYANIHIKRPQALVCVVCIGIRLWREQRYGYT